MTTYAECADIYKKAKKVVGSVNRTRHMRAAEKYVELCKKRILQNDEIIGDSQYVSSVMMGLRVKMTPGSIITELNGLISDLKDDMSNKPRYTLKDGEWVRKTVTQKMAEKFSKEFDANRAGAVLSMAQNMGACGYNSLTGRFNSPRIVDQMDSGIASAYTGGSAF